jgi:penicillin-binding protein 1C
MPKLKIFVAVVIVSLVAVFPMLYPTRSQLMNTQKMRSIRILDRHGIILREILSRNDATSQYCKLGDISPWLIKTTLNTEDRRFFSHKGIDPLALVRSIVLNIVQGDIVTGGSTITQQLARNMLGSPSRSFVFKSIEAFVALNLELKLQKKEILELYFNYAPYGNQTFGVEAASYLYFRKPARDLSLPEACFLAGIPKAPSYLDPYRYPERIIAEQRRILDRLYNNAVIDSVTYYDALSQPIHVVPKESNFNAPHFCQYVLRRLDQKGYYNVESVVTTLNIHLQRDVEHIVKNNIKRLEDANVTNAAAVVIDNRTMEILAYVGSVDFFDPLISGEVDGVRSLRQPGSALKPFTYALALEHGATAATLIPDVPTYEYSWGGDYTPHNYDEKYHGMVRLRTALACSYNIPAVKACGKFGPEKLLEKLKLAGFSSLGKSPVYYGLGLTLGTGEVTLLELTSAFSLFAHYGFYQPERILLKIDTTRIGRTPSVTVFDPGTAYIIMDILSDNSARSPAFGEFSPLNMPFFCAAKTGTSKDFRDNWCIGFTDKYLIGVWVGNFDGSPMNHVSGITGAGPLFRDIMLCVHKDIPSKKPYVRLRVKLPAYTAIIRWTKYL